MVEIKDIFSNSKTCFSEVSSDVSELVVRSSSLSSSLSSMKNFKVEIPFRILTVCVVTPKTTTFNPMMGKLS
ncbi:15495_t:CDS:2 [Funneliformis mosseae]|uniref:15495_t:CDS:1 n=1 Tax=Funneliformis mosseae TaxID=27381 RepID=A0A9N9FAL2_FUNMO|nr:15495_t:CDS:2 [Funneliformis mosseae]